MISPTTQKHRDRIKRWAIIAGSILIVIAVVLIGVIAWWKNKTPSSTAGSGYVPDRRNFSSPAGNGGQREVETPKKYGKMWVLAHGGHPESEWKDPANWSRWVDARGQRAHDVKCSGEPNTRPVSQEKTPDPATDSWHGDYTHPEMVLFIGSKPVYRIMADTVSTEAIVYVAFGDADIRSGKWHRMPLSFKPENLKELRFISKTKRDEWTEIWWERE